MDLEEIQARAGFQILMSARVHVIAEGYEQETDDILGRAAIDAAKASRLTPRPADYSVYWTAEVGPKIEKTYRFFYGPRQDAGGQIQVNPLLYGK